MIFRLMLFLTGCGNLGSQMEDLVGNTTPTFSDSLGTGFTKTGELGF